MRLLQSEGAAALLHCGDLTNVEIVHACAVLPCYYVLGNNDDSHEELGAAITAAGGINLGLGGEIELGGKRIALTHGDNLRLMNSLLRDRPDYLMFGHSHVKEDRTESRTRRINPGALHRASVYTVAILDLVTDDLRYLVISA